MCMKKIWHMLVLAVFCLPLLSLPNEAAAENLLIGAKPSCAILKFVDTTDCTEVDGAGLLGEFIADEVIERNIFAVQELAGEVVYPNEQAFWLNNGFIEALGREQDVKYFLTGRVLKVDAGVESDDAGTIFGSVLGGVAGLGAVNSTNDYVKVKAELRVVRASDDDVVWHGIAEGRDADNTLQGANVNIGGVNIEQDQYYRALEKCGRKLVENLAKDIKSRKLKLSNF